MVSICMVSNYDTVVSCLHVLLSSNVHCSSRQYLRAWFLTTVLLLGVFMCVTAVVQYSSFS